VTLVLVLQGKAPFYKEPPLLVIFTLYPQQILCFMADKSAADQHANFLTDLFQLTGIIIEFQMGFFHK